MEAHLHTYSVVANGERPARRHPIEAETAEEAAMAFLDHWHPDDAAEVTVAVTDCETGREHCFRLDIWSGEARPCD
jgi:hypothetical protein